MSTSANAAWAARGGHELSAFSCSKLEALRKIIYPTSEQEFFSKSYERDALRIARSDRGYFRGLLEIDEIDRILTTSTFRTSDVFLVNAKSKVAIEEFTATGGLIDVARMFRLFAEGATIILNRMNRYHAALARVCLGLESAFGATCSANVYMTPPNGQGFGAHFDTHDTVILQLHGAKRWRLYGSPIKLPIAGHGDEANCSQPGPCSSEFDLHPGDTLYIPRGTIHDATSIDGTSVHVTLGIFAFTWADLLLESLALTVLEDPRFRHSLPRSFTGADSDTQALDAEFRSLLKSFAEQADLGSAVKSLADQFALRRMASFRGQITQIELAGKLTASSSLRRRESTAPTIVEDSEHIRVVAFGNEVALPRQYRTAVEFALGNDVFLVGDIPQCGEAYSCVDVARQLVYSGMFVIETGR